ncbi:MAG: type II toxin-antitoxin system death-on-curing family toxin [Aquiluna sp.]|nr:type II toxin-antitoxin system death-on-curing family toxin [Aquiluna sp.]
MTRFIELKTFKKQAERIGFIVKDLGLLDSALSRPKTTLFGEDAYPALELKAAAMVESMLLNHPMIDGNKRSAWFALNLFLELNDREIVASIDQAFDYILAVATKQLDLEGSAIWIANHSKSYD